MALPGAKTRFAPGKVSFLWLACVSEYCDATNQVAAKGYHKIFKKIALNSCLPILLSDSPFSRISRRTRKPAALRVTGDEVGGMVLFYV